ncbi:hypothetical protein GVAV_002228 [Gurleya vavrai]
MFFIIKRIYNHFKSSGVSNKDRINYNESINKNAINITIKKTLSGTSETTKNLGSEKSIDHDKKYNKNQYYSNAQIKPKISRQNAVKKTSGFEKDTRKDMFTNYGKNKKKHDKEKELLGKFKKNNGLNENCISAYDFWGEIDWSTKIKFDSKDEKIIAIEIKQNEEENKRRKEIVTLTVNEKGKNIKTQANSRKTETKNLNLKQLSKCFKRFNTKKNLIINHKNITFEELKTVPVANHLENFSAFNFWSKIDWKEKISKKMGVVA